MKGLGTSQLAKLTARLAKYENTSIPPSLNRGSKRKMSQTRRINRKSDQKKGHKGMINPTVKSNSQVRITRGVNALIIEQSPAGSTMV